MMTSDCNCIVCAAYVLGRNQGAADLDAVEDEVMRQHLLVQKIHAQHIIVAPPLCRKVLECGGECILSAKHEPPCMCVGDTDGPGSCPV